jgi:ring-1,2-phenylacetyl-CoA epoxidase subunit PaaE
MTVPDVVVRRPVKRRPTFHPLPVHAVDRLTDDAVAVTFEVPEELRKAFAFKAGQHVTVRRPPEDDRRSYSICSAPRELDEHGRLRIGVKQVPDGVFSTWACGGMCPGDVVDVLPPLGHFTTDFEPTRTRYYGAVAAGSGITPVLSLLTTALETEPDSRFTLLYGNRYARSVMFAEELADLKDRYPARLHLVHVLSREPQADLLSGRLDADRLTRIFESTLVDPAGVDEWFLCGPYRMVLDAKAVLGERTRVHSELFHVDDEPPAPRERPATAAAATSVRIRLDGRESTFEMAPDERVLDAALKVRPELPYACKGGVCSTCKARVVEGQVEMARNHALEPDETANGYVLTCQSVPMSATLVVDYDA